MARTPAGISWLSKAVAKVIVKNITDVYAPKKATCLPSFLESSRTSENIPIPPIVRKDHVEIIGRIAVPTINSITVKTAVISKPNGDKRGIMIPE